MRSIRILLPFLLGLVLLNGCANSGGQVTDIKTESEFQDKAIQADKPVMVKFYKHLCPACIAHAGVYKDLARQWDDKVVFVEVERGVSRDLRGRYGIGAYPTVVLLIDGRERARWVNKHNKDDYQEALKSAVEETRNR